MVRHITVGLKAVLDDANVTEPGRDIAVNAEDVGEALEQIGKLADRRFPEATVWKKGGRDSDRVHIEL